MDYKADFVLKLEKKEEEKARQEAERGQRLPDSLITWIFQDDFIPRGKITKDGSYSVISEYLGTPVEVYDEEGNKVWERELDIYGRVKKGRKGIYGKTEKEIGEKNFIPFRFQGQYEDEEIGFFETVSSAFKHLIKSKIFGENSEEITYFISMSDDERTPEIENHSAKLLNSKSVYEEFLKRTEFWE